jgi:glycolate oxidase
MRQPPATLDGLRRILSPDRVLAAPAELAAYESDGLTAFRSRPLAAVLPMSRDEVVATVRWCAEHGVPFTARGSGTSLSGGSVPVEGGVVIALNRLNRILALDPEARVAVVEPGVINLEVSRAAAPHGLYYAPDPSSQQVCTIGGNVAFNSGGAHCLKYGMTANHVLGVVAVLPDGEVVELGSTSIEPVGPDLVGMFCGHEGLFGVALEITLRLLPKPERFRTVLAAYASLETAGDAVSAVVSSGLLPGALEIMDRLAIEAAEAAVAAGYPRDAAALLIVELDGEADAVDADFARLEPLIRSTGATSIRVAADEAERATIWKGRKSAFSAVGRLSPDFLVQDGVVPRARLGEALARIEQLAARADLRVANVFHAGDGNLHPLILFDGRRAGELERAEALAGEILRLCIALGGSITGEHGVGLEKREYLPEMFDADSVDAMWRIRAAVDPALLSNPGKMFPGEAPVLSARSTLARGGLHPLERAGVISRV